MDNSFNGDARRNADAGPEARPMGRSDAEEMGSLGQPSSEPAPRGTFILLLFFLLALVASWVFAYLQIWERGVS